MDHKLFSALMVIMPVLDDYQQDNISDQSVGLFEDREFTAAYKTLKSETEKEQLRQAAPDLLDALSFALGKIEQAASQYSEATDEHLSCWTVGAKNKITAAIVKAKGQ